MGRKQPIILELGDASNADGTAQLETNRLRSGQSLSVQIVSVRSDDEKNGAAHISVVRGATLAKVATLDMTKQGYTYDYHHQIWLESDAQLRIDFTHVGATCPIHAWIFGYLTDTD